MFLLNKINSSFKTENTLSLIYEAVLVIICASFLAKYVLPDLWKDHMNLCHTIIEFLCAFIAFSTFISVWYVYERNPSINHIVSFGFFMMGCSIIFHTYYSFNLTQEPEKINLSIYYLFLTQLIQIFIFLACTFIKDYKLTINKWLIFLCTLILTALLCLTTLFYPKYLDYIVNISFNYHFKYIPLFIFSICLYKLKIKINQKSLFNYRYIFMGILISFISQIFFIFYGSIHSFYNILSHLLKAISFYYIFQGTFISSINYPYKKLEQITVTKEEQEMLYQQKKLAALGQMATGIVHEIKNPLTGIKGFCQLINRSTDIEKIQKYTDIITNEVADLNKVISSFLHFAKPKPLILKEFLPNELIHSMNVLLESHCFIKGVALKLIFKPNIQKIMVDDVQIKQVIINIVENALDAVSERKDPCIKISTLFNESLDEYIISIYDNGIGITPQEQHNIGTPFFTTKDTGTGLGLSICFQILKNHGGKISMESEKNKGTTFNLHLPTKEKMLRILNS